MKRVLKFRVAILVLALLVGIGAYLSTLPVVQAMFTPGVCTYYQTAALKKVVGQRGTGCCGEVINWGITTPYRKCEQMYCLDVWCGPPTE